MPTDCWKVGCEQIGHEGKQVSGDMPFEPARIAHGVDKADSAVQGQNIVVSATVASDREPAERAPLRKQISNTSHVQRRPVWPLAKDTTRTDRRAPAYRQPTPQGQRQGATKPVRQDSQFGGRGTLRLIVPWRPNRSGYQPAQIREPPRLSGSTSVTHLPGGDIT